MNGTGGQTGTLEGLWDGEEDQGMRIAQAETLGPLCALESRGRCFLI